MINHSRCLLAEARISKQYWPEVVKTAVGIGNRLITTTVEENKTPYEISYGRKPSIKRLMLYGRVYVKRPNVQPGEKLDKRASKGVLVGYTDTGYRVLLNNKIVTSRHMEIVPPNRKIICSDLREGEQGEEDIIEEQPEKNCQTSTVNGFPCLKDLHLSGI